MRIASVHIKNFRAFKDEIISFDNYTCLIGANGAGKSTVLCALNVFFRETENSSTNLITLEKEDFHAGNTSDPIEITVTFTELSEAAKVDFADYFRNDKLIITARGEFDNSTGRAKVIQYGNRTGMAEFANFFALYNEKGKAQEALTEYKKLREVYNNLPPANAKAAAFAALRSFENDNPDKCTIIPSEDEFYGFAQGQNKLRKYVQWVYVPAVKDAAAEQAAERNTALRRLLDRTIMSKVNFTDKLLEMRNEIESRYQEMLDSEQAALDDISADLQKRLAEWSHPDAKAKLSWYQDPKSSIRIDEPMARLIAGDGEFEGSIARFGHGLQRSYIIALLHGLAVSDDTANPRLILGIEEPELYQHPPQARHLAEVLQTLSNQNSQVIASTHSPYFVNGQRFNQVRLVRKDKSERHSVVRSCSITHLSDEYKRVTGDDRPNESTILARLHQVMQPHLSEMFFCPKLVLVEGPEDAAYIHAWMTLTERSIDMRKGGVHIVPVNGKSELLKPIIIAKKMEIPTFVIFDCDGDKEGKNADDTARIRREHERDNKALFELVGCNSDEPFPSQVCRGEWYTAWPNDIGSSIQNDAAEHWSNAKNAAANRFRGSGRFTKNALYIAAALEYLFDKKVKLPTLDTLCDHIIDFAKS